MWCWTVTHCMIFGNFWWQMLNGLKWERPFIGRILWLSAFFHRLLGSIEKPDTGRAEMHLGYVYTSFKPGTRNLSGFSSVSCASVDVGFTLSHCWWLFPHGGRRACWKSPTFTFKCGATGDWYTVHSPLTRIQATDTLKQPAKRIEEIIHLSAG